MQYLPETDKNKPLSILEDLVAREPVAIHGSKGNGLVVMTLEDYKRMDRKNVDALLQSMHRLSDEARRNGLTEEKLAELLADIS